MGERLKDIYPHATKWEMMKYKARMTFKRLVRLSVAGGLLYGAFIAGGMLNPITSYATIEKLVPVETVSPVLERIAKCESGNTHYKNGQVIFNSNKNGSVDIGKYQINSIWNSKATELGLDLSKEKDNEAFAMYLYKTHGTEPWYSSVKCWNK